MPPAPARRTPRWAIAAILVGVLVLLMGAAGAATLVWRSVSGSPAAMARSAASELGRAEALRLKLAVLGTGDRTVEVDVTITADGEASGVIVDQVAGRADLVARDVRIAVRGDRDFWARRAPDRASRLAGRWIHPDDGVALPVDLSRFSPPELERRLRNLAQDYPTRTSTSEPERVGGVRAVRVGVGDRVALLAADSPHQLLWFGMSAGRESVGPNSFGSSWSGSAGDLAPVAVLRPAGVTTSAGGASSVVRPGAVAAEIPLPSLPYVAISPAPADPGPVRTAVAQVLPAAGPGPTAGGATPSPGSSATGPGPVDQSTVTPKAARFQASLNASTCSTPVCTWSVTVRNVGDAPGSAVVHASATPGMPVATFPLGVIPAGGQASTPPMSFANPAPRPAPGQTTRVTISYQAWVYSATMGADPAALQRLKTRGIDPNRDLPRIDAAYLPTVVSALDTMTAPGAATSAPRALDAVQTAVRAGLLPELKVLVDSRRLVNPEDLADKLGQVDGTGPAGGPEDKIGYRREVEQAAAILRHDPSARIIIDGYVTDPQTGAKDGADILDVANRRAYQLKTVHNEKLAGAVQAAVSQLNGGKGVNGQTGVRQQAPPGYEKIVVVYLETRSPQHQWGRDDIERKLRRESRNAKLCDQAGTPQIDRLVIVDAQGSFEWAKEDFGAFGSPCQ